jgi:formiminotetrahydrofolate cyclodeaminase
MTVYRSASLKKYLDDLAAKKPAPGGGSACALAAGLGASLISMVINFTLGKPKYAQFTKELQGYLKQSERLRTNFLKLVDLDVIAYQSKNVKKSLGVPRQVCDLCLQAMKLCPPLITKGNKNLISDVAVAALLLESAFMSAYFNVEINLKYLNDDVLARRLRKDLVKKIKIIKRLSRDTEVKVGKIIRG